MGVINITSTGITITPYIKGQVEDLERSTSVYEKISHKWIPTSGFYDQENESFLTYKMSLDKLKGWFPGYEISYIPTYYKGMDGDICLKDNFELRQNQKDVISDLVGSKKPEIFINIPTATGKTVIGVWYSVFRHQKTLIMCFSAKILKQWEESILEFTNANEDNIVRLSSDYLEKVFNNEIDLSKADFILATPNVFSNYINKYGYEKLATVFTKLQIGLKIFDEAHRNLGMIVKLNALMSSPKTVYMSADFNRGSRYARNAFFNVFHQCYRISLKDDEMRKLKHIITVFVNYDSKPDAADITKIRRGSYKWSHVQYAKYQYESKVLESKCTKIINTILKSEPNITPRFKILVLCYLIDHVESLSETLSSIYEGKLTVGKYHSKMTAEKKEAALNCDIIVSIYGSFSTGINVINPEIRHVISTVPVDEVTINQSAGRCRPINGMSSFLWVLCDTGFEYCIHNRSRISRYLVGSKVKLTIQKNIEEI